MKKMNFERGFWGFFFIAAALILVLGQTWGYPEISWFRLIITGFLIASFIKSIITVEFTGVFFSLAFLGIMYGGMLGISVSAWTMLVAATFLSIGFSMLFRDHRKKKFYRCDEKIADMMEGESIYHRCTFGTSSKYMNTDDFKKAKLSCQFGTMKVFFDNAVIQDGDAIIDVDVSFGEIQLYFPRAWKIDNQISVSLGDVKEVFPNTGDSIHKTILIGNVSFGDVKIFYI